MTYRWRMKNHKTREIILRPTDQRLIIHNPLPTFSRFLDPTMLVNGRTAKLNEVSLSSPSIFCSTSNLAASLTTVLDQYPGIGKQ